MIPLRDTLTSRTLPVVNTTLIVINLLVFLQTLSQPAHFYHIYGLVPARYTTPAAWEYFGVTGQMTALVSFMFLHGGWLHLFGNMLSLYIFGDNVEDRLGHVRYLLFYLGGGVVSGLSHMLLNPGSTVPTIGASGAVAAVMGAYFLLYPRAKVLTLVPLFFIPLFFEIPAFIFLGIWFLMQFFNATGGSASAIAWWAHIGGFLCGMAFVLVTGARKAPTKPHRFQAVRSRSPRLQIIHVRVDQGGFNLTGRLAITPKEARKGAVKRINLFRFGKGRLIKITVPPGVEPGKRLRLKGLGLPHPNGSRGDLFLTIAMD
ncbi:rhomboid family intramembrane serine protease [Desulfoluna butyratoxydans]|uniref:Chaperone dnaj c-terminal n=1 Tax=Desulfoluna butyratoxydans TaxID=231438 RepID=A0A4U8YHN4_9BACT|nr:rhomboid family intramembrane serine protease [Desulfoluna butyratoxydans]VFQ43105.1 chaperone dnaj c-terminal [Desulfoluna butyratoxydans]